MYRWLYVFWKWNRLSIMEKSKVEREYNMDNETKQKIYTVSETRPKVNMYKVKAYTKEEAIKQVQSGSETEYGSFTTDVIYQIEEE